jgi:hypothetical protein
LKTFDFQLWTARPWPRFVFSGGTSSGKAIIFSYFKLELMEKGCQLEITKLGRLFNRKKKVVLHKTVIIFPSRRKNSWRSAKVRHFPINSE